MLTLLQIGWVKSHGERLSELPCCQTIKAYLKVRLFKKKKKKKIFIETIKWFMKFLVFFKYVFLIFKVVLLVLLCWEYINTFPCQLQCQWLTWNYQIFDFNIILGLYCNTFALIPLNSYIEKRNGNIVLKLLTNIIIYNAG